VQEPSSLVSRAAALTAAPPETRLLASTKLCDGCIHEPLELDYFGHPNELGEPPRVDGTTLTQREFARLVRRGAVLIIENATQGMSLHGWSCERLSEEFPKAKMRREYDWKRNPNDKNLQMMGDGKWVQEQTNGEDAADRMKQDGDAPPFAPFYWAVREHSQGDLGGKEVVKKIKQLITTSVPRFAHRANANSMFENAEFWLGAERTGARAHMDSHCIPTLSFVLKGARRWRIGPPPRMPKGAGRSKDGDVLFDDGIAYALGWKPLYQFVVKEGEALLFPPGWIHETYNVADGCTAALTTQFDVPMPAGYYRSYYNRLRRIGDLQPCWTNMFRWGGMARANAKGKPLKEDAARKMADQVFKQADSDGDGLLSATEVSLACRSQHADPNSTMAFYDVQEKEQLEKENFTKLFLQWAATEAQIAQEKPKAQRKLKPDMSLAVEIAADGVEL